MIFYDFLKIMIFKDVLKEIILILGTPGFSQRLKFGAFLSETPFGRVKSRILSDDTKNAIFICWVSFAQGGSRGGGRGVNFSNFIPHGRWVGGHPSLAHQSILTILWFMMVLFKSSSFICMPFQFRSLQHTSGILKYQKHWNIWNTEITETLKIPKTLKYLKKKKHFTF